MGWISVECKLPKHEEDVLMASVTGFITIGFYCDKSKTMNRQDGDELDDGDVTHWMPLPPAPEVGA